MRCQPNLPAAVLVTIFQFRTFHLNRCDILELYKLEPCILDRDKLITMTNDFLEDDAKHSTSSKLPQDSNERQTTTDAADGAVRSCSCMWLCASLLIAVVIAVGIAGVFSTDQQFLYACYKGHEDRVREFLADDLVGCSELSDRHGNNAMHWASKGGSVKIIMLLLESGAFSADVTNSAGSQPLHWSTSSNNRTVIASLVRAGASPNAQGNDGDTPLHFAMDLGAFEAADELLRLGANPAAKNRAGEIAAHLTPIDCTRKPACISLLEEFRARGADFNAPADRSAGGMGAAHLIASKELRMRRDERDGTVARPLWSTHGDVKQADADARAGNSSDAGAPSSASVELPAWLLQAIDDVQRGGGVGGSGAGPASNLGSDNGIMQ